MKRKRREEKRGEEERLAHLPSAQVVDSNLDDGPSDAESSLMRVIEQRGEREIWSLLSSFPPSLLFYSHHLMWKAALQNVHLTPLQLEQVSPLSPLSLKILI